MTNSFLHTTQFLAFQLDKLPDLGLAKYASLEEQGVEAVLKQHLSFLRQFAKKPGISLHMFYSFNPAGEEGNKLSIILAFRGDEQSLANVPRLVRSSLLSQYYEFKPLAPGWQNGWLTTTNQEDSAQDFNYMGVMLKRTSFVVPNPPHPGAPNGYFTVPELEVSEASRLFSMAKVMDALGERVIYRIDIYPSSRSDNLRDSLPLAQLRKQQEGSVGIRDYEAEQIIKGYEKLLEKFDGSPHYNTNIIAFAQNQESCRAILDAAGSEALSKGSMQTSFYQGSFHPLYLLADAAPADATTAPAATTPAPTAATPTAAPPSRLVSADANFVGGRHLDQKSFPGWLFFPAKAETFAHSDLATLFTLEECAAFFRLPALYDGEAIQKPKETSPPAVSPSGSLYLGRDQNNYKVYFEKRLLPKHAFVTGVPGSGKTNLMLHLASSMYIEHGIPFLALEPAKREYRALLNQEGLEEVRLFSPGNQMLYPLRINPFQMPAGTSVGQHINYLIRVFEGAFPLEGALPFLLDRSIEAVYRECSWSPKHICTGRELEEGKILPTMQMLYDQMGKELAQSDYDGEVRGNLKSAFQTRIGGLLRREMGEIFNVPYSTVAPEQWLKTPAIIELAGLGRSQANFLTLLLCVLVRESLAADPVYEQGACRHVLFLEEAHNLIAPEAEEKGGENADPKQAATAFIRDMLAEVRALKEGIVIADQLPTAMAPEIIKNTGLKVGLRITSADDRELLGSTMAANGLELEEMAISTPGSALITYEGLQRPFRIQGKEWLGADGPDEIPDINERRRVATPLADIQLQSQISARDWYIATRAESASIDLTSVEQTVQQLERDIRPLLDAMSHSRYLNNAYIDLLQAGMNAGDEQLKLVYAQCREADDNINQLLAGSPYTDFAEAFIAASVCLEQFVEKPEHWAKLGFTRFKTAIDTGKPASDTGEPQIQEKSARWTEIEDAIYDWYTALYAQAKSLWEGLASFA